jgi:nitrile hydratase accessory protein
LSRCDLPASGRDEGPVFAEPWEARAFALAVALQTAGHFSAREWAETLGERIKAAQDLGDPDRGGTYWRQWLAALELIVTRKGLASAGGLSIIAGCWDEAARNTPHGQPVELEQSGHV